jgi:uncharacterized membrane protein YidH (DUF202 family)
VHTWSMTIDVHGPQSNSSFLPSKTVPESRDCLAEQRIFHAWIRTGISLTGFGFVVTRFAIFGDLPRMPLQLPAGRQHELSFPRGALSVWSVN